LQIIRLKGSIHTRAGGNAMGLLHEIFRQCTDVWLICWIEGHPGLAAYLQGIFSVLAIIAAWVLAKRQMRAQQASEREERLLEAQGIALMIKPDLWLIRDDARVGAVSSSPAIAFVTLPETLRVSLSRMWVLEKHAKHVLTVVSFVMRHEEMAARARKTPALINPSLQHRAKDILDTLAKECDLGVTDLEALAGIESPQSVRKRF
jgi:hypothetical protein